MSAPRDPRSREKTRSQGRSEYVVLRREESTQPVPLRSSRLTPRSAGPSSGTVALLGWLTSGMVLLILLGIAVLLLVMPLLTSPSVPTPGYDLLAMGEVTASILPGQDVLLEAADGSIAFYLPQGSFAESGLLVLRPRPIDLTPIRSDDDYQRVAAVDLLLMDDSGSLRTPVAFSRPGLLCFRLDSQLQEVLAANPSALRVERFADPAGWIEMPSAAGWEDSQTCALVDHLSLFALAVARRSAPEDLEPKSVPTSAPNEGFYSVPPEP